MKLIIAFLEKIVKIILDMLFNNDNNNNDNNDNNEDNNNIDKTNFITFDNKIFCTLNNDTFLVKEVS